jgi:hypothetical protein
MEGNALAVCCRLGLAADPRVRSLGEALITGHARGGGLGQVRAERDDHAQRALRILRAAGRLAWPAARNWIFSDGGPGQR